MKLLSILMTLVMMLSGGYTSEDPAAAAANVITIHNAIVTINGTEYPLNPSVTLGAGSESGSALLDVGMTLGEDVLFPVQLKIAESGLGLVIGDSGTVYTLTPAFFDEILEGQEIPDEITGMMDSYSGLLSSMGKLTPDFMLEQQKVSAEKFIELIGDASAEEATFTANGEEQTGKHVVFTLTNDQVVEYMDFCFEQMPEGYAEMYFDYMNTVFTMAGMPEVNGFADILAISGMEMTIDGHVTYNETSGVADLVYHTVVDPSKASLSDGATDSEPVSFDFPMIITVHTPENMEYSMDMDVEGAQFVVNGTFVEGALTMNMDLNAEDEVAMNMVMNLLPADNNTMQTSVGMNVMADGVSVDLAIDSVPNENGTTTACEFFFGDEVTSFGAEFTIDLTHDPIADRSAGATVSEINSAEELENNTGLVMAAMSLMSGAEKLMNDESITALIAAVEEMSYVSEDYAETEDYEVEYEVETASDAEESAPSAMPVPEFTVLPEGYELTESDTSVETYASYYFENVVDTEEYHSTLYLDMEYSAGDDYGYSTYYYAVSDEGIQQLSDPVITIERYDDDSVNADYVYSDDITFHLSYYDSDLSDEDVVNILTGIVIP